jgi:hypothetical protein
MSYSLEDLFDDCVVKNLKEILASDSEDILDRFCSLLRDTVNQPSRGEDFARRLLEIATNPNNEEMAPEQFVQRSFRIKFSELEIRKLEYGTPEGAHVHINYLGEQEKQELQEKIALHAAPWGK